MHKVTVEQMMYYDPCYDRKRVERLFAGRKQVSCADILAMRIPILDKLWAVGHLMSERERRSILHSVRGPEDCFFHCLDDEVLWRWAEVIARNGNWVLSARGRRIYKATCVLVKARRPSRAVPAAGAATPARPSARRRSR